MNNKEDIEKAIQRLMHKAEIGYWYKEDSEVSVRIGDLYKCFEKLKAQEAEIKGLQEYADHVLERQVNY